MSYKNNSLKPYLCIIVATLLLYLWQLHLYPMINPDGVTYIEAAAAFMKGGVSAVLAIDDQAKWPFYPIMIAGVHHLTHLSMWTSERILDAALISLCAGFFLHVVCIFSRHKNAGIWAIIVWLTWHAYIKWWPASVRDHGFLVCLLLSFYCYYRFTTTQKFSWAFAWGCSMLLGELFRIESAIYWLLVPFSVFCLTQETKAHRVMLWLKLNALTILCSLVVAALFITQTLNLHSLRFAYMWQELSLYFSTTSQEFVQRYEIIRHHVFYRENPYAAYGTVAGYSMIFLCYVIDQISLAVFPSLIFAHRVIHHLNTKMFNPAFLAYCGLALIIPLLFFIEYVFLNSRYLLPLGLFVLLFAASIIPHVIDSFVDKRKIWFCAVVIILFLWNFIGNMFAFGHQTYDEMEAGLWLKEHYPHQTVFTDTKRILFYASDASDYRNGTVHEMWLHGALGSGEVWLREHDVWCQYDLLALSAPLGKTTEERQLFVRLRNQGAIGSVIKSFKRKSNGEDILIAPILSEGCIKFVQKSKKNS